MQSLYWVVQLSKGNMITAVLRIHHAVVPYGVFGPLGPAALKLRRSLSGIHTVSNVDVAQPRSTLLTNNQLKRKEHLDLAAPASISSRRRWTD